MDNFTTNTYQMKKEIINFSKKISKGSSKSESKFVMDMIFGLWFRRNTNDASKQYINKM